MKKILFAATIIVTLCCNVVTAEITPETIYTSFNMRTISSSLGNNFGYYCGSYLSDIFPEETVTFDNNTLIIDSAKRHLKFIIVQGDTLMFYDTIKGGSYNSQSIIPISYNEQHCDFRADGSYIEIPLLCEPYPLQK